MGLIIRQIRRPGIRILVVIFLAGQGWSPRSISAEPSTIPGTQPLTSTGDLADLMVAGVDRFLLDQTAKSTARRDRWWKRDFHSASAYNSSVEPNRKRLAHILGVRDLRVPFASPQLVGTIGRPDLLATSQRYNVFAVRWPAFGDVTGEGLLLEPGDGLGIADVVVVPDADQLPEQLVGLVPGPANECQVARRLAESGCRVIVPTLINRAVAPRNGRDSPAASSSSDRPMSWDGPSSVTRCKKFWRWSTGCRSRPVRTRRPVSVSLAMGKEAESRSTPPRSTRGSTRPA